jgi:hypothetical protein
MNPNPNESAAVTAASLVELRQHPDAVRLISEKLQVKSMGPADHIRTKHEVKAFAQTGDERLAGELIGNAKARVESAQQQSQAIKQKRTETQGL